MSQTGSSSIVITQNMLLVADVRKKRRDRTTNEEEQLFAIERLNAARSEIPAVPPVICSARVQTVQADINPLFHALISRFKEKTGFSFRREPIVCSPEDAFRCFMGEIEQLSS